MSAISATVWSSTLNRAR